MRDSLGGACATMQALQLMRCSVHSVSLLLTTACVISRPNFTEPKWGTAPAPLPMEVTEITWELRTCSTVCTYEQILLHRDGSAARTFRTKKRLDSLFTATVDSGTFASLAREIVRRGFFRGRDGDGAHEPFSTRSLVISVATLCRRRAAELSPGVPPPGTPAQAAAAIDSVGHSLGWKRCCRID
jgi:hypothetical protein